MEDSTNDYKKPYIIAEAGCNHRMKATYGSRVKSIGFSIQHLGIAVDAAHYVTKARGGSGAIREIVGLILSFPEPLK